MVLTFCTTVYVFSGNVDSEFGELHCKFGDSTFRYDIDALSEFVGLGEL